MFLLLEFLRFPPGSLWEHFSDIWGADWGSLGSVLDPLGTLYITLGSLWRSLAPPLGIILDDFGIILGPFDCRKGPTGDEERFGDDFLLIVGDIL